MEQQKIILKLFAYKKRLATIVLENEEQIDWIMNEINSNKTFIQLGQLIIKTQDIQYIEVIYK